METTEVIKKHEKRFDRTRLYLKLLIGLVVAAIIFIQYKNIALFFNWITGN